MSSDHVAHERWMNRIKTLEAQVHYYLNIHTIVSFVNVTLRFVIN
jgi:hypothetical protein